MRFAALAVTGLATVLSAPALAADPSMGIGPQYDTAHVYVAPDDLERLSAAFTATFGGQAGKPAVTRVTPTPSSTRWLAVHTPVGSISVFGFTTGIPYPFGSERTGYLVKNMNAAISAAKAAGADVLVAPFPDPIGQDAIIQWPGGVNMQLYVHDTPPSSPALETVPENRIYISPERADAFLADFLKFSGGRVTSDAARTPGAVIGRPGGTFREVKVSSDFGKLLVFVTDGHLPFPFGRETTGYEVQDLGATLAKATQSGAVVLAKPVVVDDRTSTIVQFPGGYIAEIHETTG
jgi:predicted enzyme related to lactoylglutathione lyase